MTVASTTAGREPARQLRPRALLAPIAASALLLYFVLVGATPAGELLASARIINTIVGALLVGAYVIVVRKSADRIDAWVVVSLVCFAVAAMASELPRQSLDALLAMVGYAAGFSLLRVAVTRPLVLRATVVTVMALAAFTVVLAFTRLSASVLEWWLLTGVAPPLGLAFSSAPWSHFYDFVLLTAMLIPAWLLDQPTRFRTAVATLLGILAGTVVLLQGARAVWLAVLLATSVALAPTLLRRARGMRLDRRLLLVTIGVVALVLAVIGGPLTSRLFSSATLDQRWEMWRALLETWGQRLLTGLGPGTFPWALQGTSYFDTNALAPRHPDSAVFQLLGEAGLLGVGGVAALVIGVGIPLLRSRSKPAIWAVAVFVFAGLGMNPTDFGYLVIVVIWWAAVALPKAQPTVATRKSHVVGGAFAAVTVLLALPISMTLVAGLRYERARDLALAGDARAALSELDAAVALDPSMALYVRQRGSAHLLSGDAEAAATDFTRATELNPYDDLAWRSLALAHREAGAISEADKALDRAIDLQRSDPTNLLLKISWGADGGSDPDTTDLLAEVVLAWPTITGAPGWEAVLPAGDTTRELINLALDRWTRGLPSIEPITTQALWLAAVADRPDLHAAAAAERGYSDPLIRAFVAVVTCAPSAGSALEAVPDADRRTTTYWQLVDQHAAFSGADDAAAERMRHLFRLPELDAERAEALLSPLRANDRRGYQPDEWGYRRPSIPWPSPGPVLPDPRSGELVWTYNPARASAIAGLPAACQRDGTP